MLQATRKVRGMKRLSVADHVEDPGRWFGSNNWYAFNNHQFPIHHRTKEPMPRFAGVLALIGGNRTLVGSTSHFICSPLGATGNCVTKIRKHQCNRESGELTCEFITKLATIPRVQEENWARLTCPTLSCSTSKARSPSIFAATCALTKGVTGLA